MESHQSFVELTKWPELSRFGASFLVSEKNAFRDRVCILQIHDLDLAINSSELSTKRKFYDALVSNGFSHIEQENSNGVHQFLYKNPDHSKTGINLKNIQGVFPYFNNTDLIDLPINSLPKLNLDEQARAEWGQVFEYNKHIYSTFKNPSANYENSVWINRHSVEFNLTDIYQDFIRDASSLYASTALNDNFPIQQLQRFGYKADTLIIAYMSMDAALSDGHDSAFLERIELSSTPFFMPLAVNTSGSTLAITDLRHVPEIFDYLPSQHESWAERSLLIADVSKTYETLSNVYKNISKEYPATQDGAEEFLNDLSNDLTKLADLNKTPSTLRHSLFDQVDNLLNVRKNPEDSQWYKIEFKKNDSGKFRLHDTELLNDTNIKDLLNFRNKIAEINSTAFNPTYNEKLLENIDVYTNKSLNLINNFYITVTDLANDININPSVKNTLLLDEMESTNDIDTSNNVPISLAELAQLAGLKTAASIKAPDISNESLLTAEQTTFMPENIQSISEIVQKVETQELELTQEYFDGVKFGNVSNDTNVIDLLNKAAMERDASISLSRKAYEKAMQDALLAAYGDVQNTKTIDEALNIIAPIDSPPPSPGPDSTINSVFIGESAVDLNIRNDQSEFAASFESNAGERNSSDQNTEVSESGQIIDLAVGQSDSSNVESTSPYEDSINIIQSYRYIPDRFFKSKNPKIKTEADKLQSYRLYATFVLLPQTQNSIDETDEKLSILKTKRDTIIHQEISNIHGIDNDIFPSTTVENITLAEVNVEINATAQLSMEHFANLNAIQERLDRIDLSFEGHFTTKALVFANDGAQENNLNKEELNEKVGDAYSHIFSNPDSHNNAQLINTIVDEDTRIYLEKTYPIKPVSRGLSSVKSLAASQQNKRRIARPISPISRKHKAHFYDNKYAKQREVHHHHKIHESSIHNLWEKSVPGLYSYNAVNQISILGSGLLHFEKISGNNEFTFNSESSVEVQLLRKLGKARQEVHPAKTLDSHLLDAIKDDYGFKSSKQSLTDLRVNLSAWALVLNDKSQMFSPSTINNLENVISSDDKVNSYFVPEDKNGFSLATHFVIEHIPDSEPKLSNTQNQGWGVVKSGLNGQYNLEVVDINNIDHTRHNLLKSKNFNTAINEAFDHYKTQYIFNQLNISRKDSSLIQQAALMLRKQPAENVEDDFENITESLWGTRVKHEDFTPNNFAIVLPSDADIQNPLLSAKIGSTTLINLSESDVEKISREAVLLHSIAFLPTKQINVDDLPSESPTKLFAHYLEPNNIASRLSSYLRPNENESNIKFDSTTQFVNDLIRESTKTYIDIEHELLPLNSSTKLDVLVTNHTHSEVAPAIRLLPNEVMFEVKQIRNNLGYNVNKPNQLNKWNLVDLSYNSNSVIEPSNAIDAADRYLEVRLNISEVIEIQLHNAIKIEAASNSSNKLFPKVPIHELPEQYKSNSNFYTKNFDFIDSELLEKADSIETLQQAKNDIQIKIFNEFAPNFDTKYARMEAENLIAQKQSYLIDLKNSKISKGDIDDLRLTPSQMLEAQRSKPISTLNYEIYSSRSFSANDLNHIRIYPSFVAIPDNSPLVNTGYRGSYSSLVTVDDIAKLSSEQVNKRLDKFESSWSDWNQLDISEKLKISNRIIASTYSYLEGDVFKQHLDKSYHPFYKNFNYQMSTQDLKLHEDMVSTRVSDRNSINEFYRDNILYLASEIHKTIAYNKEENSDHSNPNSVQLQNTSVVLHQYSDTKLPYLTLETTLTKDRQSPQGSHYVLGKLDITKTEEELTKNIEDLIANKKVASIFDNQLYIQNILFKNPEIFNITVSATDFNPNLQHSARDRLLMESVSKLVWKAENIEENDRYSLAIGMKPSDETESAKFALLDLNQNNDDLINEGFYVIGNTETAFHTSIHNKIFDIDALKKIVTPEMLIPKHANLALEKINATGVETHHDKSHYLDDVGHKFHGAHKDRFGCHFTVNDIREMNEIDAEHLITKAKVWPKPNIKVFLDKSDDVKYAILSKAIYDSLPSKPKIAKEAHNNPVLRVESYSFFNDLISKSRDAVINSNSTHELINALRSNELDFNKTVYSSALGQSLISSYAPKGNHSKSPILAIVESSKVIAPLTHESDISSDYVVQADIFASKLSTACKEITPDEKLNIRFTSGLNFSADVAQDLQINKELALYVKSKIYTKELEAIGFVPGNSQNSVISYSESLDSFDLNSNDDNQPNATTNSVTSKLKGDGNSIEKTLKVSETTVDGRPDHVQQLTDSDWGLINSKRIGHNYRNGKDIDAIELRSAFGLKGIEFGTTVPKPVRQVVLNQSYDSLIDLSEALKIEPAKISMGVGLAFASRGVKNSAAHLDTRKDVINLTAKAGAGSLAHEYIHQLDSHLLKIEKDYLNLSDHPALKQLNKESSLIRAIDNGYKAQTTQSKLMAEVLDSIKFKPGHFDEKEIIHVSQIDKYTNSVISEWNIKTNEVAKKSSEPELLSKYLKWHLDKQKDIIQAFEIKLDKQLSKEKKYMKDDHDLSGLNNVKDQIDIFIQKATPRFGTTSASAFVKSDQKELSEKERSHNVKKLLSAFNEFDLNAVMSKTQNRFYSTMLTKTLINSTLKFKPNNVEGYDCVNFINNSNVARDIGLIVPVSEGNSHKVKTEYLQNAENLDFQSGRTKTKGNIYFSAAEELLARAGETLVHQRLVENEKLNTFLVHGSDSYDGLSLPSKSELLNFEKKFGKLIQYSNENILSATSSNNDIRSLERNEQKPKNVLDNNEHKNEVDYTSYDSYS